MLALEIVLRDVAPGAVVLPPEPRGGHEAAEISRFSWRCGFVAGGCAGAAARTDAPHRLEKLGWSKGSNVRIDYRFAPAGTRAHLLARELVALQPDVILAQSTPATAALKPETSTIPIVFAGVADPIGSGFVASLSRPSGNLTGLLQYEEGITGKWLAMLKEIAPNLTRAALLPIQERRLSITSCGLPKR
jgi:putative tryptophan/tyrosine transport system substrate-binding protein